MTAPAARRVHILRDTQAPLWFLRCAVPCLPRGECMEGGCYLGGSLSAEGAAEIAKRRGWEVVE